MNRFIPGVRFIQSWSVSDVPMGREAHLSISDVEPEGFADCRDGVEFFPGE